MTAGDEHRTTQAAQLECGSARLREIRDAPPGQALRFVDVGGYDRRERQQSEQFSARAWKRKHLPAARSQHRVQHDRSALPPATKKFSHGTQTFGVRHQADADRVGLHLLPNGFQLLADDVRGNRCIDRTRALFCAVTAVTTSTGRTASALYTCMSAASPAAANGSTLPMLQTTGCACRRERFSAGIRAHEPTRRARWLSTSPVNMWRTVVWCRSGPIGLFRRASPAESRWSRNGPI